MRLPKDSKPRDRYLTLDEIQRLLTICKHEKDHPQIYPVVFLTINTGMRFSEVTNIKLEDLDTANKSIILPTTKNTDPHMIYLTDEVLDVLSNHIKQTLIAKPYNWRDVSYIKGKLYCTDREYLFPSLERTDKPVYIGNAWKKVRKLSKLNDGRVVYHTLRHTTASILARQGKTLNDIAHVLNHKDLRSTRRYIHLLEEHKRENFAAITKAITGKGA
jgi:integrase